MFNNTQGTLQSVPAPIVEFYIEEVRQEAPEYHDVVYLMEKPRVDLKSWAFVEAVADANTDFKGYAIAKACEAERWQFHDAYLGWLQSEPREDDEKYLELNEDEQPIYSFEQDAELWLEAEPLNQASNPAVKVTAFYERIAIDTRYHAIYAPLPIDDTFVDMGRGKDGILGIENIKDALTAWNAGMTEVSQVNWIMADNSVKQLGIDDLNRIVVDFNRRKQDVFAKYAAWREGDKLSAFSVN